MKGRSRFRFRYRGIMGALAQALGSLFDKILNDEETAGNDNVFYNPQDLTSLRVGTDGSGGSPAVGDPVGMMLDTSGLSGSMEEFLGGQPELVTNGTFDTDTDWTKGTGWSISGGVASAGGTAGSLTQAISLLETSLYEVTYTVTSITSGNIKVQFQGGSAVVGTLRASSGTYTELLAGGSGNNTVAFVSGGTTPDATIDNISIKEIPGNHAIAPSDAARPTLMDDPDTTWASLTDDGTRGENLRDSGVFTAQTGWTDNGDGSYSANATSFNGLLFGSLPLDVGSEYLIEFTVDGYTSGLINVFLGQSGADYVGAISAIGAFSGTYKFHRSASPTLVIRANPDFVGTISGVSIRKVNTAFDERGPELVTNGGFDTDTDWTLTNGSITGGEYVGPSSGLQGVQQNSAIPLGSKTYLVEFDAYVETSTTTVYLRLGANFNITSWTVSTVPKTYSATVSASGIDDTIFLLSGGAINLHLDNISVKEVPYPNLLLASNGSDDDSTFDTDTGNWTKGTGWSIGSGVASCDGTQTAVSNLSIAVPEIAVNKFYRVQFYVSSYTAGQVRPIVGTGGVGSFVTTSGWHTETIRASGTSYLFFQADASFVGSIDNVIIQELPSTTPTSYYLDTDGTDDRMAASPALDFLTNPNWWHTGAWQADDETNRRCFALSDGPDHSPLLPRAGNWEGITSASTFNSYGTRSSTGPDIVTIEQADLNSMQGRVNGVDSSVFIPADQSPYTPGLRLFGGQVGTGSRIFDGRFYGGAWGQGQVDYDELTTLQDYLGTLVEPDINPTDVTSYASVYEMLSAQTAAALFDIDDTTSLRVGRDGSGGVPVDGDPVGLMMDVSGAGGSTMAAYLAGAAELVTNGTFDTDTSGWSATASISAVSGRLRIENSGTGYQYAYQSFSTTSGQFYKIDVELFAGTAGNVAVSFINGTPSGPSGGAGSKSFIVQATSSSIQIRITCNVATTSGVYVEADNISVKPLPGYIATAPSDAARPTLASVLDETASELTDDGTRGDELVTNGDGTTLDGWSNLPAGGVVLEAGEFKSTGGSYKGLSQQITGLEIGALYEASYDSYGTDYNQVQMWVGTGLGGLQWDGASSIISTPATKTTTTFQFYAQATSGYVNFRGNVDAGSGVASFDNISVKKVQTVFDGRGDELVTNGGFDTDSDWTKGTGWSISGGAASHVAGTSSSLSQNINLTAGSAYNVTVDATASGGTWFIQFRTGTVVTVASSLSSGSYTFQAVAASGNDLLSITAGTGTTLTIDNISVKKVLTPNLLLTSAGDDNSTFDTVGDWTLNGGVTVSGGTLNFSSATPGVDSASLSLSFDAGKWYMLRYYISGHVGGSVYSSQPFAHASTPEGDGWFTHFGRATSASNALSFFPNTTGVTLSVDNISIQEVPASVARAFYLDFDGVDDNLILDGTDFGSSTNATLYKTFRGDSTDLAQMMFGTISGPYILVAQPGSTTTTISGTVGSPVYREDGAIASYVDRDAVFTALIDNTDHTIGVEEAYLALNGSWASSGFYIGQEYNGSFSNTGRLYSWAAVDTRLDGRNRDLLENFMISRKTS